MVLMTSSSELCAIFFAPNVGGMASLTCLFCSFRRFLQEALNYMYRTDKKAYVLYPKIYKTNKVPLSLQ